MYRFHKMQLVTSFKKMDIHMFRTTLLTSCFQNQEKDICTKSHICVEPCIDFKLFVLGVSGNVSFWTCKVCMYIYTSCYKVCVCCFCVSLGLPFQMYSQIEVPCRTHPMQYIYRERCTDLWVRSTFAPCNA